MSVHYVTHLKVERVENHPANPGGATRWIVQPGEKTPGRTVTEVGSITVKAKSLDDLVKKIAGHVALFDDEPAE